MYSEYTDPETRIGVAMHVLNGLLAGRHNEYKVADDDINKAVDVADRLLARLQETAPRLQESDTETDVETEEATAESEADAQPPDLTEETPDSETGITETEDLPAGTAEALTSPTGKRRTKIEMATAEES